MRGRLGAGIDEPLGQAIQLVATVEPAGEAGEVALDVLGTDVMVGSGERGLDVAERSVDPAALAAAVAKRASSWTAQGEGHPLGGLRAVAGDHREMRAAGPLDCRPARQAVAHHIAASGEVVLRGPLDLSLPKAFDHRQAQPPGLALRCRLDLRHERRLAGGTPPALAARPRAADLDPACELGLAGVAHLHRRCLVPFAEHFPTSINGRYR